MILLFGAEISKVYATTIGPHPQIHVSLEAEKILEPLEKFQERIEKATKGTTEMDKPENAETASPNQVPNQPSGSLVNKEEALVDDRQVSSVQDEPAKDEESETGSIKVSVVIKTERKKRKKEEPN